MRRHATGALAEHQCSLRGRAAPRIGREHELSTRPAEQLGRVREPARRAGRAGPPSPPLRGGWHRRPAAGRIIASSRAIVCWKERQATPPVSSPASIGRWRSAASTSGPPAVFVTATVIDPAARWRCSASHGLGRRTAGGHPDRERARPTRLWHGRRRELRHRVDAAGAQPRGHRHRRESGRAHPDDHDTRAGPARPATGPPPRSSASARSAAGFASRSRTKASGSGLPRHRPDRPTVEHGGHRGIGHVASIWAGSEPRTRTRAPPARPRRAQGDDRRRAHADRRDRSGIASRNVRARTLRPRGRRRGVLGVPARHHPADVIDRAGHRRDVARRRIRRRPIGGERIAVEVVHVQPAVRASQHLPDVEIAVDPHDRRAARSPRASRWRLARRGCSPRRRSPAEPVVTESASSSLASASARQPSTRSARASATGTGNTAEGVANARWSRATRPPIARGVPVRHRPVIPDTGVHDVLDVPGPTVARAGHERGDARDQRVPAPHDGAERPRDLLEAHGREMRGQIQTGLPARSRAREELDDGALPHHDRFVGLVDADRALRSADRDRRGVPIGGQRARRSPRPRGPAATRRRHRPPSRSTNPIVVRRDRGHEHVLAEGSDRDPAASRRDHVVQDDARGERPLEMRGQPDLGRRHVRSPVGRPASSTAGVYGRRCRAGPDPRSVRTVPDDPRSWHRASTARPSPVPTPTTS